MSDPVTMDRPAVPGPRVMRLDGGLLRIPITLLDDGPNVREHYDGIAELAVSLAENGQEHPILVERLDDGRYLVRDGMRRRRAAPLAGLDTLDAVVRKPPADDAHRAILQLTAHAQTRPFEPIAEAHALHRLIFPAEGGGMSRDEVARRIGKTKQWIEDRLSLLVLSPEEQARVERRELALVEAKRRVRQYRTARDGHRPATTRRPPQPHCTTCRCFDEH
jgi:ParB family transcriptional regulator, chromosome partitioning protein